MRRGARSFWAAARFLPADVRADVAVLYAFCRTIDDAADEATDPASALAAVARLRQELTGAITPSPLMAAYLEVAERRQLPLECALMLLDGVSSDIGAVRIADEAELLRYSYRVASTVGLMMCRVVGCRDAGAAPFAVDLGIAMQITNIVRDVAEDARRDRVYLPADLLAQYGVNAEQVRDGTIDRGLLRRVTLDLLALADRYYASAEQGVRLLPAHSRIAVFVASRLYAAIGRRVRRTGHDPLAGRVVVPTWEKAIWIASGLRESLRPSAGRACGHDAQLHGAIAGWPGANPHA